MAWLAWGWLSNRVVDRMSASESILFAHLLTAVACGALGPALPSAFSVCSGMLHAAAFGADVLAIVLAWSAAVVGVELSTDLRGATTVPLWALAMPPFTWLDGKVQSAMKCPFLSQLRHAPSTYQDVEGWSRMSMHSA